MKKLYILTLFICANFISEGNNTEALDSIANHYFNEIGQSFIPGTNRMFIEMNVATENYSFMDELTAFINETIESYSTSNYSIEEMRNGIYNLAIDYYPYGNVDIEYDPFYSSRNQFVFGDVFNQNGSYIINVCFHKKIEAFDNINFKYQGLNFASDQFLLPFFKEITDVSIYQLQDIPDSGFCAWNFVVLCGHIIIAQYISED